MSCLSRGSSLNSRNLGTSASCAYDDQIAMITAERGAMQAISLDDISFIGAGLSRPECVLTTSTGDLFVSDSRGGVSILRADGSQHFVKARETPDDFLPNGIALLPGRDVLVANLGDSGGVWRLSPDGRCDIHLATVDGVTLPSVNFVGIDQKSRVWVTISTGLAPRENAMKKGWADGYIILQDDAGARIVADGIGYTNEAIVDPTGQWLYVNETIARRTLRFPIRHDNSLGEREVVAAYPPATFPDGFAFDAEGGVWCVSVASNRVIRVAPDGEQSVILEDADPATLQAVSAAFESGEQLERAHIDAGKHRPLANVSSIAFGGPDLKTVYLGSLFGERIATFRSSIAGARPVHWTY
ncbi:MAG: SMP-30/gluconolactonase/LRE family protein [Hyphomicrobiaceae bacterium]